MASYPHNTTTNKPKPWPAYFIVRTSGEVVPLIGVDELPLGTDLVGIPRALDLEDTIGMLNLGIQRSSEACYQIVKVEVVDRNTVTIDQGTDTRTHGQAHPQAIAPTRHISSQHSGPTGPSHTRMSHRPNPRNLPETQTCRHWCTHGICKWGQQCRYRHIMPMTLPGLQEIGLQDWPGWYRSLNPGFCASEATTIFGSGRRLGKMRCGNGCCGGLHLGASAGAERGRITHARAERMRGRERREDTAEATLDALRKLPREMDKVRERGKEVSGTVLLERAAAKDTRGWEEEEESEVSGDSKEDEGRKGGVAKTSLLD